MFTTKPLPGGYNFGAVVERLSQDEIEDPKIRKALNDVWIDRGMIVFKGLDTDRTFHFRLSTVFGGVELHPIVTARLPEQPEITALSYNPDEGPIYRVDGRDLGAHLNWHSDLIYHDKINRGGLLRAIEIPPEGGRTGFIDQIELYSTLPEELKQRIEGLNVIYHYNPDVKRFGRQRATVRPPTRIINPDEHGFVAHPMVFTQAETGRKVLNVSPWFATAIEGMETPEGDALLARIVEHCEDESRAYYHQWEPGDMVLWDNWRMLHCCDGMAPHMRRRVERTTLKGDYNLGRVIRPARARQAQPVDV